jgi:ketosteroid isomerase-like protein
MGLSGTIPEQTAMRFNDYINNRDLDGLSSMMTGDHTFIDSSNDVHAGKVLMVEGWREFFDLYPDYQNHFTSVKSHGNLVIMLGYSTCSNEPALEGPAIWTARIADQQVREWRVYEDTPEIRRNLGIRS